MTDLARARSVLGVAATASWDEVRRAYIERIRVAHPDRGGDPARSTELNLAYRALGQAHRAGRLHEPDPAVGSAVARPGADPAPAPAPGRRPPDHDGVPDDVRLLDGSTVILGSPPDVAFVRLLDAVHSFANITSLDRSASIFEASVDLADGSHASLVVSLQRRSGDESTEAYCTLERLERAESLEPRWVIDQMIRRLAP